ncbi:MAG TPA: 30S ribosomal protein S27ae [Candidatus Nanoarchaeia archaeon]|nr:30S ribosomal protein S27ae [Candidatus Nanoarchaeia archaeon]
MVADKKAANKVKKAGKRLASLYTLSDNSLARKNKFCFKCGPGIFLARHSDRVVCGKCGYMEKTVRKV